MARMSWFLDVHTSCVVVRAGMPSAPDTCIFMVTLIFIMLPESDCAEAVVASSASAHRQQMRIMDDVGMGFSGLIRK